MLYIGRGLGMRCSQRAILSPACTIPILDNKLEITLLLFPDIPFPTFSIITNYNDAWNGLNCHTSSTGINQRKACITLDVWRESGRSNCRSCFQPLFYLKCLGSFNFLIKIYNYLIQILHSISIII